MFDLNTSILDPEYGDELDEGRLEKYIDGLMKEFAESAEAEAFMPMSIEPNIAPKTKLAKPNSQGLGASTTAGKAMAIATPNRRVTRFEPHRSDSTPASGMALTAPRPPSSSSIPSRASVSSSVSLMCGSCGAHMPIDKPFTKKIAHTAAR